MSKPILTIVASLLAVAIAVAFLGHLAIHIGALSLGLIVLGVIAMMVWDYVDTLRTSARAAGNANGRNGTEAPASGP